MIFTLVSCKQEVAGWDALSTTERDYIRNQARLKCLQTYEPYFKTYKKNSEKVFSSYDFRRGKGYYHELKEGDSIKKKVDFRIWKQSSNEIYFYVTENVLGTHSYFLRIQHHENDDMIEQLRKDHCDNQSKIFTSSSVGSQGPLSVRKEYILPNAPNTDHYNDSYTFNFNELAYFATYTLKRTLEVKDSEDKVISTTNYTSSWTGKDYEFTSSNANDSSYYTQKFCELDLTSLQLPFNSEIGYGIVCNSTTVPGDWDLSI